jgi:putative ABC transport system substrate-binding protein
MSCLRAFLFVFLFAACAAPPDRAQADARPERLVIYVNADNPRVRQAIEILQVAFAKTGVAARHRIKLVHVAVDVSNPVEIETALRQALKTQPAVIIATNSNAAAIAKSLTRDVPIVFGSHQDPIRLGLAESLARPGSNLTGFTYFVPIDQKRLEFLRQLAPGARRLGVVVDRWWLDESGGRDVVSKAWIQQGFEPVLFFAETIAELKKVLATPGAREMDAWYVPYTELPFWEPDALMKALETLRKPVIFPATVFVERGGLVSYQPTLTLEESSLLWATMVGLILDGVPAGEIPIERPKAFELAINVATAKRLGLVMPAPFLKRAERVVFGQ